MTFKRAARLPVMFAALLSQTASAQVGDPLAPLPQPVTIHRESSPVLRATPVLLQPATSGFEGYKPRLAALARLAGVREATIAAVIPTLALNSRVMQLDRGQPGQVGNPNSTPPFEPYRRAHVTADLIRRGTARYVAYSPQLTAIEARTGVAASVLMAIYGHETSYGTVTGGFDIVQALATLAYEGRRRPLFESEFVAALKLLDSGIPRWRLKGSWAGATGYPQFMPSAVLRLRADGDGDGRADIWSSEMDGLMSIANFLREAGWKANTPWGIPVRVPYSLNRASVRNLTTAPDCPRVHARYSRPLMMSEWRAMGIYPVSRTLRDDETAYLFEPDGTYGTAYLLTGNYKSILKYNCSNFYALSVGILADRIIGR
ncbi:MAG: lytic murein transglycosylase [Sphingomicrobium sp.]